MITPVHLAVHGRARFKVDGLYRSRYLQRHIEQKLGGKKGINDCRASHVTGTVLISFNTHHTPETLTQLLAGAVETYRAPAEDSSDGRNPRSLAGRAGQAAAKTASPPGANGVPPLVIRSDTGSGRIRIKVQDLYRCEQLKSCLETVLSREPGIETCKASSLTGCILVRFNALQTSDSVFELTEACLASFARSAAGRSLRNRPRGKAAPAKRHKKLDKDIPQASIRNKIKKFIQPSEDQVSAPWHTLSRAEVLERFSVDCTTGLTKTAVRASRKKYGPNLLPEAVPRSGFQIFISQFNTVPVALLSGAALLSAFTGGLIDAVVIMSVVVLNSAIGCVTEGQSERTINSLKKLVEPTALVLRDGEVLQVNADEVVVGDVLVLRNGTYVAADARLTEAEHLSIDESVLTGESMPVRKSPRKLKTEKTPLPDRSNMVYMGTLVTGGQGLAVVVATGKFTEMGKIQLLADEARPPETPMERQLGHMGTKLVWVCSIVCGIVFLIGLLRRNSFLEMLKLAISLAVAAVPEGLPTVATTTLALGIRNMRRHKVLIRHLDAVECLGSIQTICLDKTGTLTMNKMAVVALHVGMRPVKSVNDVLVAVDDPEDIYGSLPQKHIRKHGIDPFACDELLRLLHVCSLCNESEVVGKDGAYAVNGSATENALIRLALGAGVNVTDLRNRHPLVKMIHRSEQRNFMISYHGNGGGSRIIAVKGSPTEVLSLCSWHMKDGCRHALTDDDRQLIERENERMAQHALRVLGVAYAAVDEWPHDDYNGERDAGLQDNLVWLGMVGMADPIRDGVKEFIGSIHEAGIDTVMITGDQSPAAYAIGKELNLSRDEQFEILDSTHLADIGPDVMQTLSERVHAFARVSPAHKLQIVQALQQAGRVVAMTGDGINDGPALKAADLGIAMGHTGTDVAREIADVVLEDDNLETMIVAVSQGRTIYNNIRKSLRFLLSTNMSEIMVMAVSMAAGLGQPLNAIQLLWINLLSDIFPGLALAMEQPEPDIISRPPRDPDEPIIDNNDLKKVTIESAVISASTFAAYGYGIARYGMGAQAGTIAFSSLTTAQILHALSCRSETHSIYDRGSLPPNRCLDASLGGILLLQVLAMVLPPLRSLLRITPLGLLDFAVVGASAVAPLLINELFKTGKPMKALPAGSSAPQVLRPADAQGEAA